MAHLKGVLVGGYCLKLAQDWFISHTFNFYSGGAYGVAISCREEESIGILEVPRLSKFRSASKNDTWMKMRVDHWLNYTAG